MSKLAKLVAISLAVSQGEGVSPNRSRSKIGKRGEYFKEMDKQMIEAEKLKSNTEIRQAINVLKRFRKRYWTKTKTRKSTRKRSK
jgi:hypothetical protein